MKRLLKRSVISKYLYTVKAFSSLPECSVLSISRPRSQQEKIMPAPLTLASWARKGTFLPSTCNRPTHDLASQSWPGASLLEQGCGGTYLLSFLVLLKVDKAEAPGLATAVSHHLDTLHLS